MTVFIVEVVIYYRSFKFIFYLHVYYVKTLSVTQTVQRRID
jgi:hypothetical protein